jgi:hypothetical protein
MVGMLLRKIAVARFCRTLATLTASGVPILDGLEITAKTAGNAIIEDAVMAVRKSVEEGKTISERLADTKVFPPMVVQMIGVGEQTGALDQMAHLFNRLRVGREAQVIEDLLLHGRIAARLIEFDEHSNALAARCLILYFVGTGRHQTFNRQRRFPDGFPDLCCLRGRLPQPFAEFRFRTIVGKLRVHAGCRRLGLLRGLNCGDGILDACLKRRRRSGGEGLHCRQHRSDEEPDE